MNPAINEEPYVDRREPQPREPKRQRNRGNSPAKKSALAVVDVAKVKHRSQNDHTRGWGGGC